MEGGNEQHLALLLKKFNQKMYLDYVAKTEQIIKSCDDSSRFTDLEVIKTPDKAGDLAFRADFEFPIHIMLSHPICTFKSHRNYPVGNKMYIANLGLVPVFFSSVNLMSVLKLWGERATGFFNPTNTPLADSDAICWELPRASKPAQFSSMNFILQNGADPQVVDPTLTTIFEKYFRLLYWTFPHQGFSPSTHFLHGNSRISSQVKISKSLYIVEEVRNPYRFSLEGKMIEGTYVMLRGLNLDGDKFLFQSFPAVLDSELAEQVLARRNLESSFINGVVAEVSQQTANEQQFTKHSLLTVVSDYGESYYDIISALTGMIADSKFACSDSLSEIGPLEDISLQVTDAYRIIYRMLKVERSLSEDINNVFELVIDQMFPALVEDNGLLFYVHPLAWGLLKKWNLISSEKNKQKDVLLHLIRLLQISETSSSMKVYLDKSSDYFQRLAVSKRELTRSVYQLANAIRLLKVMRKIWTTSPQPSIHLP
ncbi:MAG: hypothetical protein ABSF00_01840 [Candidatus Bathyarchaeia archaeon]|jgi:hypothetical protein